MEKGQGSFSLLLEKEKKEEALWRRLNAKPEALIGLSIRFVAFFLLFVFGCFKHYFWSLLRKVNS